MITNYQEFTEYVDSMGAVAFSGTFIEGFPNLNDLTDEKQWHTGDIETDPWQWKDRAAAEKKLAFGCLLGGHKGFVSKALYPYFYAACSPRYSVEERYMEGKVSPVLLNVYRLFEEGGVMSTAEIRGQCGVSKKHGASKIDSAVVALQKEFYITICGNRRKVGKDGEEYGWPANTYCRADIWHADWLINAEGINKEAARGYILSCCGQWRCDANRLSKALFGKQD
ncbi:MAG: hypothetical protein LBV27_09580 [Oscillospiraceae bacterium]|jgi:hypothetical protein|nr:hypothetical protein [Oscillospiraceae bacterium]